MKQAATATYEWLAGFVLRDAGVGAAEAGVGQHDVSLGTVSPQHMPWPLVCRNAVHEGPVLVHVQPKARDWRLGPVEEAQGLAWAAGRWRRQRHLLTIAGPLHWTFPTNITKEPRNPTLISIIETKSSPIQLKRPRNSWARWKRGLDGRRNGRRNAGAHGSRL